MNIAWSASRYWIRHFPMSFDLNPELSQAIYRLQEVIIQDDDEDSELAGMVDISKVYVYFLFYVFCGDISFETPLKHNRKIIKKVRLLMVRKSYCHAISNLHCSASSSVSYQLGLVVIKISIKATDCAKT